MKRRSDEHGGARPSKKTHLLWQTQTPTLKLSSEAAEEIEEALAPKVLVEAPVVHEEWYRVDVDPRPPQRDRPSPAPVEVVEAPAPAPQPAPIVAFGLVSSSIPQSVPCSPLSPWWLLGGPPALAKRHAPPPWLTSETRRRVTVKDVAQALETERHKCQAHEARLRQALSSLK